MRKRAKEITGVGSNGVLRIEALLLVGALIALLGGGAGAQELPPPPLPVDPTPLTERLTERERRDLLRARPGRRRLDVYLRVSDARVEMAYAATVAANIASAEIHLDSYNKALDAAMSEAASQDRKNRRALSKRIEQRIFRHIKTLEAIERRFPNERLPFAEAALKNARELRVQALHETFATGEVLRSPGERNQTGDPPPEKDGILRSSGSNLMRLTGARRPQSRIAAGDYLTEEEEEQVRTNQVPDERMKVFMKIADRRLQALAGTTGEATADRRAQRRAEQEARTWGVLPELDRVELLKHYARTVEEAITKLEDAYERNPKHSSIPKALKILLDATDKHLETLRGLDGKARDDREAAALKIAISEAEFANKGAREGLKN